MTTGPLPTVVSTEVDMQLVLTAERTVTVAALLDYAVDEPFSVRVTFRTSDGDVRWVFARELLSKGLYRPIGDGDISVWPSKTSGHDVLCISLSSPNGHALMEARREDIERFLERTYDVAAEGAESALLDIDSLIQRLLEDDRKAG